MDSVEESGVRPMETRWPEFSVIQRFLCKRISYSDAEQGTGWTTVIPDTSEAALSFIPEGGPIEFYLFALRVYTYRKIQRGDM